MYEIIFHDIAEKQLKKLNIEIKDRILDKIERIKIKPYSFVKKLIGSKYYRLRVGEYRIVLDIQSKKLIIFVIELGHRRNIYKK